MKIKWEKKQRKYGPIFHAGKVGKWMCFKIEWNSYKDQPRYDCICLLPGIKEIVDQKDTEKQCMDRCQEVLNYWIECLERNE